MTFTQRPLAAGETLGERFRALRTESHLELADLARLTGIAVKYLEAIEQSRYRDLPGLVYARQFVRRYAEVMETDVGMALSLFEQEYADVARTGLRGRPLLTPRASTEFPWWRRHIRFVVASALVLLVLTYLGVQAARLYLPPKLLVTQPDRDISTTADTIAVQGSTDPQASVTINDQDVQLTSGGTFNEQVDLHQGLNTLKISAIKKHSTARVVTRQVLVEEKTDQ